jgi:hypothetical protein
MGAAAAVFVASVVAGGYFLEKQSSTTPVNFHLTATTHTYTLLLQVSPPQSMYTSAQVASQHPSDGEVMLSGTMTMPPGMSGATMTGSSYPAGWHHVEIHVYDRLSNQVIANANLVIRIHDDTTGDSISLPIVTMQGIVAGPQDFHYGNNAELTNGHAYTLTAHVDAETASFHFNL